ncbi:MAG TPA: DNA translocase FtsK, partial [Nitrospiria bacterium]
PFRKPRIVGKPAAAAPPPPPPPKQARLPFKKETGDPGDYETPALSLLTDIPSGETKISKEELLANSQILEKKLRDYGIEGRVAQVHPGPVITMYEFEPAPGVKVQKIVNLSDDLALAMRALSVRVVAPIPGKSVVGIEIPNTHRESVSLREILSSEAFSGSESKLKLALGKDISGTPVVADLASMPHLLIAGSTGSGKSVALNTMILSLLYSAAPDEVKLIMIDPKLLELSAYDGIPHLQTPVIVRPKDSPRVFQRLVDEMQFRYRLLAEVGARNIESYNKKARRMKGETGGPSVEELRSILAESKTLQVDEGDSAKTGPLPLLPYLVVIVDELADLMLVSAREIEDSITRLAQMARAAGIHLVVATQRPSVDVLTGLIKANFPARISFKVTSKTDSRTILDANGAEQLLGRGDMLFLVPGTGRISRIHGPYVSEEEIRSIVEHVKSQAKPHYVDLSSPPEGTDSPDGGRDERDELYEKAVGLITTSGSASASLIQRRLRVGYPRAARMIEMMEEDGIVGPASGGRAREVLNPQDGPLV